LVEGSKLEVNLLNKAFHEYKELVVDYSIIIHNIKKANYISKKAYDAIDLLLGDM
jgi:hypothetical protein